MKLREALKNELWLEHKIGDTYVMDGSGGWKIAYYPILEDNNGSEYDSPRALVEKPKLFNGVVGIDIREVPLHYLTKEV